ncbi:MAG: hypothetical protein KJ967_05525 [Elusimicrobia bacterium]|nr:hypothetical protein [Elusimicrobiota bacterium]
MKKDKLENLTMNQAMGGIEDQSLKKIFARIDKTIVQKGSLWEETEKIKKALASSPKKEEQQVFAFIPHEMAKVSIFFPMSKKEMKEERREVTNFEHHTNWGSIVITGVKLAIFEEDVFLALMKLARDKAQYINNQFVLGTSTSEIAKLLYGRAGYTKTAYEGIKKALEHFGLINFKLKLSKAKKEIFIASVIQRYDFEETTGSLKIKFNPDFCAFFLESMLTGINFTIRRKLKKDGSKALLRFLATHRNLQRLHILTALKAINYNIEQPMFRLRSKIKEFVNELKKENVLGPKTKIYSDDTVFFDTLSAKKELAENRG